ncbi:MAG: hypothetical protein KKD17_02995 [Nanoarchaeota archaeon]|nr:hypothetical protein [Nanoarchaeota archaeon]
METAVLLLYLQIVAEAIGFIILVYILYTLSQAERGFEKSRLLENYELMKRDKIFRAALMILAASILCVIVASILALDPDANLSTVRSFRFVGSLFRVWFFIFLLRTVGATKH